MRRARVIHCHEDLYARWKAGRKVTSAAWSRLFHATDVVAFVGKCLAVIILVDFDVFVFVHLAILVLDLHGDLTVARTELAKQGIQ